jgi:hypothetical protein
VVLDLEVWLVYFVNRRFIKKHSKGNFGSALRSAS